MLSTEICLASETVMAYKYVTTRYDQNVRF